MSYSVRINGTAPAWPVMLGQSHPFYDVHDASSMGSTSFSILKRSSGPGSAIETEFLIDAGHNTVPFLLQHGNRIPEAIILTHGHPDHILSVDWIIQSLRFREGKPEKMPVYCTLPVWETLLKTWGHIESLADHYRLMPGQSVRLGPEKEIRLTPFPVYHGSGTKGSLMLLMEFPGKSGLSVLFTGDMLCPLLRKKDILKVSRCKYLFTDCNNRFPFPASNHISFTSGKPSGTAVSGHLADWLQSKTLNSMVSPHQSPAAEEQAYWDEFLSDWEDVHELSFSILDLTKHIHPGKVYLMHYFAYYDLQHYREKILNAGQLEVWANERAVCEGIQGITFHVPSAGDEIPV